MNRRLFFGSLVGLGAATSVQVDAERIREGDVLVLEHPGTLSEEAIANRRREVEATFTGPERLKIVILEEGMRAKLLRPEAAKGLE